MIVCLCHRVSESDIAREAAGCLDFEELQDSTRVGTACGVCKEHAQATFDEARACSGCPGAARCGSAPLALPA